MVSLNYDLAELRPLLLPSLGKRHRLKAACTHVINRVDNLTTPAETTVYVVYLLTWTHHQCGKSNKSWQIKWNRWQWNIKVIFHSTKQSLLAAVEIYFLLFSSSNRLVKSSKSTLSLPLIEAPPILPVGTLGKPGTSGRLGKIDEFKVAGVFLGWGTGPPVVAVVGVLELAADAGGTVTDKRQWNIRKKAK